MENLSINLDIEECEEIFRNVEEDFEGICGVYTNIINATGDYAQAWQGENVTKFREKMEYFRERIKEESSHMDMAIAKMRGCLKKAKEIEELV